MRDGAGAQNGIIGEEEEGGGLGGRGAEAGHWGRVGRVSSPLFNGCVNKRPGQTVGPAA